MAQFSGVMSVVKMLCVFSVCIARIVEVSRLVGFRFSKQANRSFEREFSAEKISRRAFLGRIGKWKLRPMISLD